MENTNTQNPPEEKKIEQPVETQEKPTEEEVSKTTVDEKKELEAFRNFLQA